MTDAHRHEWVTAKEGVLCGLVDCHARLRYAEICQRLNAVECLSVEDAVFAYRNLIPTDSRAPNVDYSLRAYVKTLEGDDAIFTGSEHSKD